MNPLRDADPDPRDARTGQAPDDADPTGVRAMLSALPEPGPMPADLVRRITTSLAAEQARRRADSPEAHPAGHGGDSGLPSLTEARERRRSRWAGLPAIAVAASVVVLAGAVLWGVLTMDSGLMATAGSDSAAEASVADLGAEVTVEGGSAELFGATEDASEDAAGDAAQDSSAGGGAVASESVPAADALVLASGASITGATVVEHARSMRQGADVISPDAAAERTMATSAAGTPEGAADCLSGLLGIPLEEANALVEAIDLVWFDYAPAVLILTRAAGADASATQESAASTAYLVPLDCDRQVARTLHEPVRVS